MTGLFKKQPASETKTQVILYLCEGSVEMFGKTPDKAIQKTVLELGIHGIRHEFRRESWCHPKAVVREVPRNFRER